MAGKCVDEEGTGDVILRCSGRNMFCAAQSSSESLSFKQSKSASSQHKTSFTFTAVLAQCDVPVAHTFVQQCIEILCWSGQALWFPICVISLAIVCHVPGTRIARPRARIMPARTRIVRARAIARTRIVRTRTIARARIVRARARIVGARSPTRARVVRARARTVMVRVVAVLALGNGDGLPAHSHVVVFSQDVPLRLLDLHVSVVRHCCKKTEHQHRLDVDVSEKRC